MSYLILSDSFRFVHFPRHRYSSKSTLVYNQGMRIPNITFRIYSFVLIIIGISICIYAFFLGKHSKIQIQWTTATEFDTAGFNLYRANSPDGPFVKINQEIIRASDDPLKGGSYIFDDANVVPGTVYWYQLEDIELSGNTTRHEPIQVKAERGGTIEWVAGLIILTFGSIGFIADRRKKTTGGMDKGAKSVR